MSGGADLESAAVVRSVHVQRFSAMGTEAEVQVVGGAVGVVERACARLHQLEARWSRFRADSDISRLNRSSGFPVVVGRDTLLLIDRALTAARATGGLYDPTVGAALEAYGYDRTFSEVAARAEHLMPHPVVDAAWPAIEVDHATRIVCLPEETVFDPGGIGKGLAADLVAMEFADQVGGILVNVGGDVRMCGEAPTAEGWVVSIENPFDPDAELARIAIPEGAVATSSRGRRRWSTATGPAHHIIDPRTGRPATTGVAAVSVVAAEAWWAEVQATSLFLRGASGLDLIDETVEALIVLDDGTTLATDELRKTIR